MEDFAKKISDTIIKLECDALDRWGVGDPDGFLEICAEDVVYFDPFIAHRIDGRKALMSYYQPTYGVKKFDRFELIDPFVQHCSDLAVLTFNYKSWNGDDEARWNCTEVYRVYGETWQIIQTHWSLTQPLA